MVVDHSSANVQFTKKVTWDDTSRDTYSISVKVNDFTRWEEHGLHSFGGRFLDAIRQEFVH